MAKAPTRRAKAGKRAVQTIPRAHLATLIKRNIVGRELSQTAAGAIVGEAPSQISLLMAGRLAGFSSDRLVRMLLRLGRDVDIVVRPRTSGRIGRVRVTGVTQRAARTKRK